MKKYRIIEWNHRGNKCYEVQKRFLGFLWWWNWLNTDGRTMGFFYKIEEAKEAIERKKNRINKTIVYTCS